MRAGDRTGNARGTRWDRAPSPGGFGAPVARAAPGPLEGPCSGMIYLEQVGGAGVHSPPDASVKFPF